jgi:serine/threonine-protein kinase
VNDAGAGNVSIIDNDVTWANDGQITTGIAGPDGNFVDAQHNFYEADYVNLVINEFAHAGNTEWIGSSPSFVYSSGLTDPIGVAADTSGNVYAANWNFGANGAVVEFAQASNTPINTCSLTGGAQGVAIDKAGDVFVDENTSGAGSVIEYVGGLSGCSGTPLSISGLGDLGGMAIDKTGNLIICDQTNAKVDIVAPPYTSITGTLGSGYIAPFHVSINKTNKVAYVADDAAAVVDILSYPSGSLIFQLGSAEGLVDPYAAVYGANAVY